MACLGLYVCETMHCFHLREAEEECGGANEEESGCRHRDVARGSEGSAGRDHGVGEGRRGWTPPSTLTAATWHHFQCVVVCVCVLSVQQPLCHSEFNASVGVLSGFVVWG